MVRLALELRPLELLEALHDRAVRLTFFIFNCCHSAKLRHVLPPRSLIVPVLRGIQRELKSTISIERQVLVRGRAVRIRICLHGLHDGGARRDQVQVAPVQLLLLERLHFTLALGEVFRRGLRLILICFSCELSMLVLEFLFESFGRLRHGEVLFDLVDHVARLSPCLLLISRLGRIDLLSGDVVCAARSGTLRILRKF